ncbi:MAG: hypothetical protein ACRDT2_03695 [Natronosporangium sp.]
MMRELSDTPDDLGADPTSPERRLQLRNEIPGMALSKQVDDETAQLYARDAGDREIPVRRLHSAGTPIAGQLRAEVPPSCEDGALEARQTAGDVPEPQQPPPARQRGPLGAPPTEMVTAAENTDRQERANALLACYGPTLRSLALAVPIATLGASDGTGWARLREQLDQMTGARPDEMDAEEAVARELATALLTEGGDPERLDRMLDKAGRADRSPGWLDEFRAEALKEPVITVLEGQVEAEVAEAALELLALVLALPTGPAAWLWLATKLLAAADT